MRLHMLSEADEPMMGSSHLMAVQIFLHGPAAPFSYYAVVYEKRAL